MSQCPDEMLRRSRPYFSVVCYLFSVFLLVSTRLVSCLVVFTSLSSITNASEKRMVSLESSAATKKAVEFARLIGRLKTTPRTGWVRHGVPRYESVADHSWRVAAMSLLLLGRKDDDFDVISKCIPMALMHDVAECIIGDIPPDDNVSAQDKLRMENLAMNDITQLLFEATSNADSSDPDEARRYLMDLLNEYEERSSKEAIAVKDLDLLDMIIQADEYEQAFNVDLTEFFDSTPVSRFREPTLTAVASEVHRQRQERIENPQHVEERTVSKSDQAFIVEYGKASELDVDAIEKVVKALRQWDLR
jgi:putative hydrolases of HD superfamily